jgi:hypothetical protein
MVQAVTGLTLAVGTLLAATPPVRQGSPRAETIRTEFRVFDGATEVSAETRLRVRNSGSTETGQMIESHPLAADLPAGIYDVQAVRQQAGQVVSVRWAERLVVMAYPDEGGRHLEVINFANEHGALQLRWPDGQTADPATTAVTVTRDGESRPTAVRAVHGAGYALLVLPAGTYDVRVSRAGKEPVVLLKLEVPADRTRMKIIP